MIRQPSGFREKEHTADWELEIWAPDLLGLLVEAANGMYWLMGARLEDGLRLHRCVDIGGGDAESRLVNFLQELLYLGETQELGFDQVEITIEGDRYRAELTGAALVHVDKEIKAVTYHNLVIRETCRGVEATLVFDV